ncbi:hypothetical protein ABW20_dc0102839 [Dactylellina cionopaga]|nr:hypothetical protein ABW20_dc0102839 [Dactylellina cionopaga]
MVTTEVCVMNLKKESTLEVLKNPDGAHLKGIETIKEQPGFQKINWGLGLEDPLKLFWFIEWDNLDAHKAFEKHEIYPAFVSSVLSIADPTHPEGPIQVLHYNFPTPLSSLLLQNPATSKGPSLEYFFVTLKPEFSRPDMEARLELLQNELNAYEAGKVFAAFEFALEDQKKSLSLVLWESLEVHGAFASTEGFLALVPPTQALCESATILHVDLQL